MAFPHRYNSSTSRGSIDNDNDPDAGVYGSSYSPFLKPHRQGGGVLPPGTPEGMDGSQLKASITPQQPSHIGSSVARSSRGAMGESYFGNLLGASPPSAGGEPWRSVLIPRPTAASSMFLPPPAVTSYAYAPTKSIYEMQRSPLYSIQQKVNAYTVELQNLLDAQSAGLLKASQNNKSGGPGAEGGKKKKNSRDRVPSWDGGVTSSVLPPKKPQVSLVQARQGIAHAMVALANVKESEAGVYSAEEAERLKNISQVEDWERQKFELAEGIRNAKEGDEARRIVELRKEREAVELEIRQVEQRLRSLNAHHSSLLSKISTMESALSNNSTSLKNSLAAITATESRFFSVLPSGMRSPNLAIDAWKSEAEALRRKKDQAREEVNALREGVADWEEAVIMITDFEKNLKKEMSPAKPTSTSTASGSKSMQLEKTFKRKDSESLFGMSSMVATRTGPDISSRSTYLNKNKSQKPVSSSASSAPVQANRGQGLQRFDSLLSESDPEDGQVPEHLFSRSPSGFLPPKPEAKQVQVAFSLEQRILVEIQDVLEKLEDKVANAESKNWNLLVCCLAAEAQAFREAKEIISRRIAEMDQAERVKGNASAKELLSDNDDVELEGKFGRMEIGKGKQSSGGGSMVIGAGIDYGNMGGFDDHNIHANWDGSLRDFDSGLDAILEDGKHHHQPQQQQQQEQQQQQRSFLGDMEASFTQGGGHTTSSSISPKTPSRKNSISSRNRNLRQMRQQQHILSMDDSGNAWNIETGGFDGGLDDDDGNSTIRGTSSMQFLKGPTVGQVMRGQGGTSGGGGGGVPHAPSGISIGLGTWGSRMKKVGIQGHVRSNSGSGRDSDNAVGGSPGVVDRERDNGGGLNLNKRSHSEDDLLGGTQG